jgi:hypothetical protein
VFRAVKYSVGASSKVPPRDLLKNQGEAQVLLARMSKYLIPAHGLCAKFDIISNYAALRESCTAPESTTYR